MSSNAFLQTLFGTLTKTEFVEVRTWLGNDADDEIEDDDPDLAPAPAGAEVRRGFVFIKQRPR